MTCPLRYRLRVIDKLPEPPNEAAARAPWCTRCWSGSSTRRPGSAPGPRPRVAASGVGAAAEQTAELAGLFPEDADGASLAAWLAEAEQLLDRYFRMEDPNRLEPAGRELHVETVLESGLELRGIIDRVDVARPVRSAWWTTRPAGRPHRTSSTGHVPDEVLRPGPVEAARVVPRRLQLVYLGSGDVVTYDPDEADLRAVERKLQALWAAIQQAVATGEWQPSPSRLCDWCGYQSFCPAFGGTPPPYPLA
ncbi:RecB family exonuclease [Streptomyces sp. INA 01156]